MTTSSSALDTTDMVLVHRVFRRELGLLPHLVRRAAGDPARARQVTAHAQELMRLLHHHHSGEDDLVWPKLLDRCPPDAALVARMQAQHEEVAALMSEVEGMLTRWNGDAELGEHLAATAEHLTAALVEHLDEEERGILPLVARTFSQAEWDEIGERAFAAVPKNRRLVTLGHILEDASGDERQAFLAHVPAPARVAWKVLGRRQFAKETAAIRVPAQRSPEIS